MNKSHRLALIALLFLSPALLAVVSGLLRFPVPLALISPFLVLPGLIAAFGVSAAAVVRVRPESHPHGGVAAINVRIEARFLPLALAAFSVLLAGMLATYLFVENFRS
ncbi:MAG: hypothetical protein QOH31_6124 [Verrucomicrobiota bacterium]|jgi:hypothetical protein